MLTRHRSALRALLLVAALAAASADAGAQLKLPRTPRQSAPSQGDVAPYRLCGVCSARNYTHPPSGRMDAAGRELAWCDDCQRDTPQSYPGAGAPGPGIPDAPRQGGNLKLPRRPRVDPAPVEPPTGPGGARPIDAGPAGPDPAVSGPTPPAVHPPAVQPPAQPASPAPSSTASEAARLLASVSNLTSADAGPAQRAVESLLAWGADGLAAARNALFEDRATTIVVSARVLLRGGGPGDADLVVRRLTGKLPGGAGAPLLQTLVAEDPIRATNTLFAALLDHPQPALRHAAARELRARLDADTIELLAGPLSSSRSETRALALEVAASIRGERATAAILTRLADPNARVASTAFQALRLRDDAGLDTELLSRAFRDRWVLRPGAYALLAIVDREDAGLRAILSDEHVEPLLASLTSNDPFLAGACAAALAGIGFRSARADVSTWLDGTVVDKLVLAVSGQVFHDDHSSLVAPAVRRLRLVSGETFAQDGSAWVEWWTRSRAGFHARRAALVIQPGEEGRLRLMAHAPELGLDVELAGPEAAARPSARREVVRLSAAQAAEMAQALAREGVLAAARMPGAYASAGRDDRELTIEIRERAKTFTVGLRAKEPWFERLLSLAQALRAENRWQFLVDAPSEDRAASEAEAAWWGATRDESERAVRLGELALAALRGPHSARRDAALLELESARAAGALPAEAFADLVTALRRETHPGERARRIVALAIAAGRSTDARLAAGLAQRLFDAAFETFGPGAADLSAAILAASERGWVRRLAADERPVLRRAAADALADSPDTEDVAALLTLLADTDPRVYAAAAEALGTARVEAARDDLLARARLGEPSRRAVALRAAGALGGPHVLDALVLGLADPDAGVRRASVEGLGRLGDPTSAQVLASLLSDASDAPIADLVRASLVRVGPAAVPALARVADGGDPRARRDAALVLAKLVAAEGVPALLAIVSQDEGDLAAANELAILSAYDPRGAHPRPAEAWWNWWEGVRHDDALVWFRAGVERLGIPQPREGALEGEGTLEGRRFLLTLIEREEPWLAERAWREYRRLEGLATVDMPARGAARAQWVRERHVELAQRESLGGTGR